MTEIDLLHQRIHPGLRCAEMTEEKPDQRPKCGWKVETKTKADGKETIERKLCGSEERVFTVKGNSRTWNRPMETPICQKHLPDVIRDWKFDSATPIDLPTGKRE